MTFATRARAFALAKAAELEAESRAIGIMRSVDATESARWLAEIAAAIREAAGPEEWVWDRGDEESTASGAGK